MSKDWSTAYNEFTAGENSGKKPIVVSYEASPLETLKRRQNQNLRFRKSTCYNQIEYAGVITNAKNKQVLKNLLNSC